jgi:transcriptional antiterminator RfaH
MPLLPPEPFVFPGELLLQPRPAIPEEGWWVLHTRPRAEKSLARRTLASGLPFFLPLHKKQWRKGGRLFTSHVPLFPGYFFLHGGPETRLKALQTNLVAQTIPVVDQERLHEDLRRVFHLIASELPLAPEPRLQPGDPVEVVAGPLTGLQGKVLARGKRLTFVIEVQLLQQGVSVELEPWMVQPLPAERKTVTERQLFCTPQIV